MAAGLAGARGPGSRSRRWSASSTKRSVLQAAARWPRAPTARLRTARRGLLSCGRRQCRRLAWKAPSGAPSLGSQRGRQAVYWGHSSPLSTSSPDLLPRIMTTQWPFVNGKEPYICLASLLLHERKQRREGNFSRISSQEM